MSGPRRSRTRAVAHRGDPVGHRENTLAGIASALRAGADQVEIDVKLTADGEVVLLHDDTLERVWGLDAAVSEVTRTDLDPGVVARGALPTLADALALVGGTGTSLLVDLDAVAWAEPALTVVQEAVAAGWVMPPEVVWCGRPDSLRVVRTGDPAARIVLSWDEGNAAGELPDDDIVTALAPEAFNPHWPMVTPQVRRWADERELALSCWTVDDPALMRELIDLGVDAITTNRIAELARIVRD
ncbi:MAG: glycerophosphodiester phosphodiesterase [Propionibacteriaceae bacterium]